MARERCDLSAVSVPLDLLLFDDRCACEKSSSRIWKLAGNIALAFWIAPEALVEQNPVWDEG